MEPTDAHDHDGDGLLPGRSPREQIVALTAAVAALAVVLGALVPELRRPDIAHVEVMIGVAVGFALVDRLIFHLESEAQSISYAPTELLLAVGLFTLGPPALLFARVLGSAVGMWLWRRPPLFKMGLNLASFSLETVVAVLVVSAVGRTSGVVVTWLGLVGALIVASLVGGAVVAAAISRFEGELVPRLRAEITRAPVLYAPPCLVAASIVAPATQDPWLGLIVASPAPVVWYLVRSHGTLIHRYRDLDRAHDFSRTVGHATSTDELATVAAQSIAATVRARHVELRIWEGSGEAVDAMIGGLGSSGVLPASPTAPAWRRRFSDDEDSGGARSRLSSLGTDLVVGGRSLPHALVAEISDEKDVLGSIVIADRDGARADFDDADVARLATVLDQLAVVVRRSRLRGQLQVAATHDRLTGLPTRDHFEALVDESAPRPAAVLLVDVNRVKEINDAFGHQAGDTLLTIVARRIAEVCDGLGVLGRLGGDEFVVAALDVDSVGAELLATDIALALERPFDLGPAVVAVSANIGIVARPEHGEEAAQLLRRADLAVGSAKLRRRRAVVFSEDLVDHDATSVTLLADLRAAIADDRIEVAYQAQVDIATGRLTGAEALARWTHPEHGPIGPDVFVGLAEQCGLVEGLTRCVLRNAVAAASGWNAQGWELDLSVNISPQSLLDENFEALVVDALRTSGLEASRLVLELTETTMMTELERTHRLLDRLAAQGLRFSVDDFGTGYSSLVNLRHLPVTELKIDRSFVSDMLGNADDETIVRSTIDMAHTLGLVVVAEGVEDDDTLARLAMMGCDLAQGFGLSRPLDPKAFEAFVLDRHGVPANDSAAAAHP